MHSFTVTPLSYITRVLLMAALAYGPGAHAQTLIETGAAAGIQNTLNSVGTASGTPVIKKARQLGQTIQNATAQANALTPSLPAAQPTAAPTGAPGTVPSPPSASPSSSGPAKTAPAPVVITPLTPQQQTALAAAQADLRGGKLDKARSQFEALMAQNYNNPEPHFGLALTLLAQKDDKGAIFELGQFQLLAPDRYEAPYNLGVIATRTGRYDDALKLYTSAAALAQDKASPEVQAQILDALAGEQTRKADFTSLTTTLQELSVLRTQDASLQFRLAQAQALSGAGAAALPGLYALLQKQPDRVEAINLLADIYVSQGLPERALREIDSAMPKIKTASGRSNLSLHKANLLAARGDLRAAIFSAQAAHLQDPTNIDAFTKEAAWRLQRNDRGGALKLYQEAVKAAPKNAKLRTDLAALRLSMNQAAQAGTDAALALELKPDAPTKARAQYLQGVSLYRAAQYAQARTLLNASAVAAPSADTTLWLGLTNYALKDYPAAVAALSESVKLSPSATTRQNLASALLACARYPEAETVLRGLVNEDAKNANAWYLLGLAQRAQLRDADAKISWKTAANLGDARAKESLK